MPDEELYCIAIKEIPEIFYYERKKRKIELEVSLQDRKGNIVTGKYIELKHTLLYENGEEVPRQEILVSKNIRTAIDGHGEYSTLYYRIEDVSDNHKKRNFVIKLSPVKPEHCNIEDGYTTPVCVKSRHPEDRPDKSKKGHRSTTKKRKSDGDDTYSDEYECCNMGIPPCPNTCKRHRGQNQHVKQEAAVSDPSLFQDMSDIIHPFFDPKDTSMELCMVLEEYSRTMECLNRLRWVPLGEDDVTGERFYRRMVNPNATIDSLIAR